MTIEATERTGIGLGRGGRMSRKRKRDAVLRLLRGEDLKTLSRANKLQPQARSCPGTMAKGCRKAGPVRVRLLRSTVS